MDRHLVAAGPRRRGLTGVYAGPVPTVRRLLLHPKERRADPPPVAVDLTGVFLFGIGAWVIALIVTGVRWYLGSVPATSALTCIAGIVLGVVAVIWARRNRVPSAP